VETVLPPPGETARWEAGLLAVSRRWFAAEGHLLTVTFSPRHEPK
jgi:hypothetical protein